MRTVIPSFEKTHWGNDAARVMDPFPQRNDFRSHVELHLLVFSLRDFGTVHLGGMHSLCLRLRSQTFLLFGYC